MNALVRRSPGLIRPDPRRVVARLFVPGQEHLIDGGSRVDPVMGRILDLEDTTVRATMAETLRAFEGRHRDLHRILLEHFDLISHRLGGTPVPSPATRQLIGAYFTHEYAVEAAALFNPSIVEHPDQTGLADGEMRVILSLRAVGEGHLSSIEFRTGTVAADGTLSVDDPGRYATPGRPGSTRYARGLFRRMLDDGEDASFILDSLPGSFTRDELDTTLAGLREQALTRRGAEHTINRVRWIASCNYVVAFDAATPLGERVLMPNAPTETHGMEDARFVRFADGAYYATYTAYDGRAVTPQRLETRDFTSFRVSQLNGPAVANKGMALFPRLVNGRYLALSRWDRESTSIAASDDGFTWDTPIDVATPSQAWELIQVGNCGSPIETPAGWLVLTHGVGPMRRYAIGALLLDLDNPTKVLGQLDEPLIEPEESERDGYVPNVAYTCGAIIHRGNLVVPYGSADSSIGVAVFDVARLLDALLHPAAERDAR